MALQSSLTSVSFCVCALPEGFTFSRSRSLARTASEAPDVVVKPTEEGKEEGKRRPLSSCVRPLRARPIMHLRPECSPWFPGRVEDAVLRSWEQSAQQKSGSVSRGDDGPWEGDLLS